MRRLKAVPNVPAVEPKRAKSLGRALAGMDGEFIVCRDINHSWRNYGSKWLAEDHCYEQILKCTRCGTHRYRYLSTQGRILGAHYAYPEGYLLPPGTGHLTTEDRDQIRLIGIRETPRDEAVNG